MPLGAEASASPEAADGNQLSLKAEAEAEAEEQGVPGPCKAVLVLAWLCAHGAVLSFSVAGSKCFEKVRELAGTSLAIKHL